MEIDFGYLPQKLDIEFNYGRISTLENFDQIISEVNESCHKRNGFYFAPTYRLITEIEQGESHRSPSFSPHLFNFFITHKLKLNESNLSAGNIWDLKKDIAFFILQVVSYVTGYRLMPESKWFDLRVPSDPTINLLCKNNSLRDSLNIATENWLNWDLEKRANVANLLYVFNRNPSYYWDFEKFSIEYQIIDTCYSLLFPSDKASHKRRLKILTDTLGIPVDPGRLRTLVDTIRNPLVHELKWGEDLITGTVDSEYIFYSHFLHRLNHRVIGRILGFTGRYFVTDPSYMGSFLFQLNDEKELF